MAYNFFSQAAESERSQPQMRETPPKTTGQIYAAVMGAVAPTIDRRCEHIAEAVAEQVIKRMGDRIGAKVETAIEKGFEAIEMTVATNAIAEAIATLQSRATSLACEAIESVIKSIDPEYLKNAVKLSALQAAKVPTQKETPAAPAKPEPLITPLPLRRWAYWGEILVGAGKIKGRRKKPKNIYNHALRLLGGKSRNGINLHSFVSANDPVGLCNFVLEHLDRFVAEGEPADAEALRAEFLRRRQTRSTHRMR